MPEDKGMGNPDAGQDETLIQSVMQRDLGPIFEAIGSRLKDLDEDLGEVRDLLYKFTEGLIGAADNHKRTMLTDEISSKYGKDIEPFEGFYKDTQGKGFTDSILEELMGEGAPGDEERDGWMQGKLGEAKQKYGKYVGLQQEPPAEEKAEPVEKQQKEEEAGEMDKGGEDTDPVSKIMNQMKGVGGRKFSLSAKSA